MMRTCVAHYIPVGTHGIPKKPKLLFLSQDTQHMLSQITLGTKIWHNVLTAYEIPLRNKKLHLCWFLQFSNKNIEKNKIAVF
jgi:hypothetical protein